MSQIWLRYDLRSPDFGTDIRDLYRIALEQVAWADRLGFDTVQLPEHHGSPDGYIPSPFVMGAAVAARTSRMRIHQLVLLTLLDPVRVAEDAVVLDNVSAGRLELTIGLGYLPSEFAMFGVPLSKRAKIVDAKLELLRRALNGETVDYEGRRVHVTPRPAQAPHPPLYVGGSAIESARRAARLGDGFMPGVALTSELKQAYLDACRELQKPPGRILRTADGPQFIFVSEDPEAAWAQIAPHALYEMNAYGKWAEATGQAMPFQRVDDLAGLRKLSLHMVVTPEECIALGQRLFAEGICLIFNPLLSGLPEALSWSSLELFAAKVLPHLRAFTA